MNRELLNFANSSDVAVFIQSMCNNADSHITTGLSLAADAEYLVKSVHSALSSDTDVTLVQIGVAHSFNALDVVYELRGQDWASFRRSLLRKGAKVGVKIGCYAEADTQSGHRYLPEKIRLALVEPKAATPKAASHSNKPGANQQIAKAPAVPETPIHGVDDVRKRLTSMLTSAGITAEQLLTVAADVAGASTFDVVATQRDYIKADKGIRDYISRRNAKAEKASKAEKEKAASLARAREAQHKARQSANK